MNQIIKDIQTILKNAGYYIGSVDGIAGKLTLEAVYKAVGQSFKKDDTEVADTTKSLTEKDLERLKGVHPDLVKVIMEVSKETNFRVIEGKRTVERQKYLYKKGATRTLNSRHLTGHAVDIAPLVNGEISWDWQYYYPLAQKVKAKAKELNVAIEWGGDWQSFKDGPHWQLSHKNYPV